MNNYLSILKSNKLLKTSFSFLKELQTFLSHSFLFLSFTFISFSAQAAAAKPSIIEQLIPFALILTVFYFFMIRPQQRRHKTHQEFLTNINQGCEVITNSGILGEIPGITETFFTL